MLSKYWELYSVDNTWQNMDHWWNYNDRGKNCSSDICRPQTPNRLAWDRTRACAVRGRRPTAWKWKHKMNNELPFMLLRISVGPSPKLLDRNPVQFVYSILVTVVTSVRCHYQSTTLIGAVRYVINLPELSGLWSRPVRKQDCWHEPS